MSAKTSQAEQGGGSEEPRGVEAMEQKDNPEEVDAREEGTRFRLAVQLARQKSLIAELAPQVEHTGRGRLTQLREERLKSHVGPVLGWYGERTALRLKALEGMSAAIQECRLEVESARQRHERCLQDQAAAQESRLGQWARHAMAAVSHAAAHHASAREAALAYSLAQQDVRSAAAVAQCVEREACMAAIVAERELALARAAEAGERRHATARVLLEQEIGRVAVRRRKLVQEEETAAASRAAVLTRAAKRHDAAKLFTDKAEARLHELQAAASRLDLGPGGAGTGAALRVLSAEVAERRTQVQALLLTRNALGARLTDMRRRHERAIARFCERCDSMERDLKAWVSMLQRLCRGVRLEQDNLVFALLCTSLASEMQGRVLSWRGVGADGQGGHHSLDSQESRVPVDRSTPCMPIVAGEGPTA
uniref:Uncharacterized protein n=1 Tax=Auxenochlorella protothecoides TaxID=3075 RepID=A0A1D2A6V3_AUXPR